MGKEKKSGVNVYRISFSRSPSIGNSYTFVVATSFAMAERIYLRDGDGLAKIHEIDLIGTDVLIPEAFKGVPLVGFEEKRGPSR